MSLNSSPRRRIVMGGFTLIELLVTLMVTSVGLLGLAKLQSAAMAETQVSRMRSLMTFQAETLANAMRANRAYWASTTTLPGGLVVPAANGAITPGPSMVSTTSCVDSACTPAQLAYDDVVNIWASTFQKQFPTGSANVTCKLVTVQPTYCDVTLKWTEHHVAINRGNAAAGADASLPQISMILHVQP